MLHRLELHGGEIRIVGDSGTLEIQSREGKTTYLLTDKGLIVVSHDPEDTTDKLRIIGRGVTGINTVNIKYHGGIQTICVNDISSSDAFLSLFR